MDLRLPEPGRLDWKSLQQAKTSLDTYSLEVVKCERELRKKWGVSLLASWSEAIGLESSWLSFANPADFAIEYGEYKLQGQHFQVISVPFLTKYFDIYYVMSYSLHNWIVNDRLCGGWFVSGNLAEVGEKRKKKDLVGVGELYSALANKIGQSDFLRCCMYVASKCQNSPFVSYGHKFGNQ